MTGTGFACAACLMLRVDAFSDVAFSDVVFGFALTLLVVSLEVMKTFGELSTMLRGFDLPSAGAALPERGAPG